LVTNSKFQRALSYHQQGFLGQAEFLYEEILRADPQNFEALHLLGVAASQAGNHPQAVEYFRRAIAQQSGIPNVHFNLGVSLEELGRIQEAVDSYGRAVALDAGYADALLNRGNCLFRLGDQIRAEEAYRRAISARPTYAAAHSNLGNLLREMGHLDDALSFHLRAVELNQEVASYHFNLANVLKDLNELDSALKSYDHALQIQPLYLAALENKGGVLMDLGHFEDALASYQQVIALQPTDSKGYSNRGGALVALRRFDEAIQCFERAIEIDPADSQAYMNGGIALIGAGRLDAAIDSLTRAVSINPRYAEAHSNLGLALKAAKQFSEAVDQFDRAIGIQPELAEAHWNKGLTKLLLGDLQSGWRSYEWRWKTKNYLRSARDFAQPLWLGQASLAGKTILVHSEQGLGDTIQFCRYLPFLAAQGARVVFELPRGLLVLLQNLQGIDRLIVQGEPLPETDFHCPLLSLPLAFETTLATIPSARKYLEPDPSRLTMWSGRLGQKTRPRIGLVWSGNSRHSNNHNRSIPLTSVLCHLPKQLDYVSLQRELTDADQRLLDLHPEIRHFGSGLQDFADTAALCALVDLVISVDTSVAHLSGALGRPTWVLLPYLPDWRWLLDREDSPWYPSVKLYRQASAGDWGSTLLRVARVLDRGWGQTVNQLMSSGSSSIQSG
jgi:tetratricopeptide (TPR) repeat protein